VNWTAATLKNNAGIRATILSLLLPFFNSAFRVSQTTSPADVAFKKVV
jgi:hypothetical protein